MPDSIEAVNVKVLIAIEKLYEAVCRLNYPGSLCEPALAECWHEIQEARKSNLSDRPREMRVRIAQTGNPSFFWVSDSLGVRAKTPAAARDEALADAQRFAASIGHVLKVEE